VAERWRVLVCDGLAERGIAELEGEAEVVLDDPSALGSVDAWIVRSKTRVESGSLDRGLPRLRLVARAGVGVDNIDLDAARQRNVVVVTAPEASTVAVAEHTLALMLAMARRIPDAALAVRNGVWAKAEYLGVELHGKTLGLIGLGRIGRAVATRATAFGMGLIGYDPYLEASALRAAGVEPTDMETVLSTADFVSLHVPLTDETHGLLGREQLARMKPGARLVCTARGGLIDETALLEALESGHLAGAALDVFETEPPGNTALIQQPRLIATPHLGAQTAEAQDRVSTEIAREVLNVLHGEPARWRVA
jgi:D-3-phosphoglycerate dehydrogenase